MPNRISKRQVIAQLQKARGLEDRNPFTQQVVQQAIMLGYKLDLMRNR